MIDRGFKHLKQGLVAGAVFGLTFGLLWLAWVDVNRFWRNAAWDHLIASLPVPEVDPSEPPAYRSLRLGMPIAQALAILHGMFGRVDEIVNNAGGDFSDEIAVSIRLGEMQPRTAYTDETEYCPRAITPEATELYLRFTIDEADNHALSHISVRSSYRVSAPLFREVLSSATQKYGRPQIFFRLRREFDVAERSGSYLTHVMRKMRADTFLLGHGDFYNNRAHVELCVNADENDPPTGAARVHYFSLRLSDYVALSASRERENKRRAEALPLPPAPPPLPPATVRF
jgi:hypothetical protein